MTAHPMPRRAAAAGSVLVAGSLLLTACGSSTSSGSSQNNSLHGELPSAIRKSGVIKVASDLTYAPVETKSASGVPTGLDPDLAAALGRVLGVKFEFEDISFDKIIPDVLGKTVDIAMSAMTDTRERRDGTDDTGARLNDGVDFVDYFIAGTSLLVGKGNPQKINGLNDLCGKTVAIQKGTTQYDIAARQQVACKSQGKPLKLMGEDSDAQALTALRNGKSAADLNDFPVAAYAAKTVGNGSALQLATAELQPAPYGIAVNKSDTQLRDVLVTALNRVIISGEYDKILNTWNLSAGAAENAVVNGG